MKKLFYILGSLVLLGVIALVVVGFSLGSIVKAGVNKVGPQLTQSRVELKEAKISPFSGVGELNDLTIGNPAGWQSDHAFYLKNVSINVDPGSLRGDHIIVNTIVIDQPDIIYETKITTSNLQDLLKNIQQAAGGTATEPQTQPQPSPQPETKEGKPVKLEVKSFVLQNAKITVTGAGYSGVVEMPALILENLGTKEGGLTPEQLATVIMKEITTRVVQAGARKAAEKGLFDKAGEKAGEGLRKLLGGDK